MRRDTTKYSFLIIEDNLGDFVLITDFLEEMIAVPSITRAINFASAKEILQSEGTSFDIILLDTSLPDSNGVNLIHDIIRLSKQTPIMVLTGYEDLEFSIHSLSFGISDYLLKGELNAFTLYKSVLFSIERKKLIKNIKESEKRYSDLFHSSPIPMWVSDLDNQLILDVNQTAINQYGYKKSEFLKMKVRDLLEAPNLQEKDNLIKVDTIRNELEFFKHRKKTGEIITVNIESSYVYFDGKIASFILANDVTELLQTQISLRTAYENIIVIEEKEKDRFAAEIHDGIAQNLVAIQLLFSLFQQNSPDLKENSYTELLDNLIVTVVKECKELVNDVRPKALLDYGFDFMLDELIKKTKVVGQIEINVQCYTCLDDYFAYNELFNIYRIIQESFNNCLKYAKASHIEIFISANKESIFISLNDNGNGISEKILEAPSSFISLKRRLQLLNGTVKIESNEGEGTSFFFSIPIENRIPIPNL